ncbi:hypothetical protein ADIS_0606 [Lunatimonas lonarensis]|uniref:Uncharacterized protein n=1 Tax=Lunatimonas lonarensis TaxID=1232681 RepID=R7ZXJ9_9BACT|nr:BF3164 family lipoprotein [Lunatimonas lonarensis]EON78709.1 hypothetical protein ADIS_0606 [Lunatimonas lonarensis]
MNKTVFPPIVNSGVLDDRADALHQARLRENPVGIFPKLNSRAIIINIFAILILWSCARGDPKEQLIQFPEEVSLVVLSNHPTFEIRDDLRLSHIDDYLIVLSSINSKSNLSIYNKRDFSYVIDGIPLGEGPEEIMTPISLHTHNRDIYIVDGSTKMVKYSLDSILMQRAFHPIASIKHPRVQEFLWYFLPVPSGYILTTFNKKRHFIKIDHSGSPVAELGVFPENPLLKQVSNMSYGDYYTGIYTISPRQDRIFKVYRDFGMISVYDTLGNELNTNRLDLETNYEGKVTFEDGRMIKGPRNSMYVRLSSDEKYVYGLFYGKDPSKNVHRATICDEIHVFDHLGNPLKKIKLEVGVTDISVDRKANRIYGINYLEERPLVEFDLGDILL